jgi:hypothetical protein
VHHNRTPELVGNLFLGVETFVQFALESGAIDKTEQKHLLREAWEAIGNAAASQSEYLTDAEQERIFIERIRSALGSGAAHLAYIGMCGPQQ